MTWLLTIIKQLFKRMIRFLIRMTWLLIKVAWFLIKVTWFLIKVTWLLIMMTKFGCFGSFKTIISAKNITEYLE